MKKIYSFLVALIACVGGMSAQIVTTTPDIIQESSKNIVLTFHADQGNKGLMGLSASDAVYAHIGVLTNLSPSTWTHVVADWGVNLDKAKMQYVSPNTYTLTIDDLRSYFGMTNANEHIQKIALVFRNSNGTKEGKTASGGDIFVDVAEEGYALQFTSSPENLVVTQPTNVKFTAVTTQASTITITVNGNTIASETNAFKAEANYNIATNGNYTIVATASNGSETLTETLNMMYPKASEAGTYPGGVPKMGPVKNSDGSVTFCLAAPNKTSVVMVPSWDDYQLLDKNIMQYQDYNGYRYFFTTVSGLKDDEYYPYYFIVDGQYKVADPYARLVLDNLSDKWMKAGVWDDRPMYPYEKFDDVMLAVYRGDIESDYKFSNFTIPEKGNLTIYEMLFRDFTGTNGAANAEGTIRKAMAKLDYLHSLGVNAVEVMPVMEFSGNESWGYNPNFYFALDKAYGQPNDFKDFVEECHKRGMAVIVDVVFNQSDGLHPWYQMYPSGANPFYNATAPHDYSVFNDWKQENPLVRQQFKDALQYWMKVYNVDGFRFDLVKGLGTSYSGSTDGYNASRVTVMKDLHSAIKAVKPNGIHINENLAGAQEENEMAADGQLNWANLNYNSCEYAMGFGGNSNLTRFLSTNDSRTWGSTVAYAESHDEERMGYKQNTYGANGVKGNHANSMKRLGQVAVQMLMTPGPKMIWQFGELGADQTTKKGNDNDTDAKIVVWNYMDDPDRAALLHTYQALCQFRRDNPALFDEKATFTVTGFANNITSNRIMRLTSADGKQEVMAFINTRIGGANNSASGTSTVLNAGNCQLVTAHKDFNGTLNGNATTVSVSLPAHGYAVFATTNTTGVDDVIADGNGTSIMVYGANGEIVINGAYENAAVYDMSGRVRSLTGLTPGLYIVKVDGETFKVSVY